MTGPVEADTPLILTLDFTAGALVDIAPAWQVNEQMRQERLVKTAPFMIAGFLTIFFGLMIALIVSARKPLSMDETITPPSVNKPVSPPTDYKPAVAAALAARMNPSMLHSLATLIDLAHQGIITIEQLPPKWYEHNRFEFVRQPYTGNLAPHEQILMDALFTKHGQPIERIELREYAQLLSRRWSDFSKAIKLEISTLGLIHPERKRKQTHVFVGGVVMVLAGFLLSVVLAIIMMNLATSISLPWAELASALLGGCMAAFGCGLIYVVFAALYSPLSAQGRWISNQWNGFSKYLKDIIAQREQALRPDTFMQYLPFAAAFGLGSQWAKAFQKRGSSEVPAWFHALNAQDAYGCVCRIFLVHDILQRQCFF